MSPSHPLLYLEYAQEQGHILFEMNPRDSRCRMLLPKEATYPGRPGSPVGSQSNSACVPLIQNEEVEDSSSPGTRETQSTPELPMTFVPLVIMTIIQMMTVPKTSHSVQGFYICKGSGLLNIVVRSLKTSKPGFTNMSSSR